MKHYKLIIWDWNGTLCDDIGVSLECVNRQLGRKGMAPISLEQYYSYVDTPITKFYEHLFDPGSIPYSEISKEFAEDYLDQADELKLNDGAKDLLDAFREAGSAQIIASASDFQSVLRDVKRLGVGDYFKDIITVKDSVAGSKESIISEYISRFGCAPDEVLLIGDTLHDASNAVKLGLDYVITCQGHQSAKEFGPAGIKYVGSLTELREEIK